MKIKTLDELLDVFDSDTLVQLHDYEQAIEDVRSMLMERVKELKRIYVVWKAGRDGNDWDEAMEAKIEELLRIAGKEK